MQKELRMISWWKTAPFNLFPGRGGIALPCCLAHAVRESETGSRRSGDMFRARVSIFGAQVGIHSETRWPRTLHLQQWHLLVGFVSLVLLEKEDSNWFCCCRHFCHENCFVAAAVLCMCACLCVCVWESTEGWAKAVDVDFDQCGCWEHLSMKPVHHS